MNEYHKYGRRIIKFNIILFFIIISLFTNTITLTHAGAKGGWNYILGSKVHLCGCPFTGCENANRLSYNNIEYLYAFNNGNFTYVVMRDKNSNNISIIKYNLSNIVWPQDPPPPGYPSNWWSYYADRMYRALATGAIELKIYNTTSYDCGEAADFNGTHIALSCSHYNPSGTSVTSLIVVRVDGDIPELVKFYNISFTTNSERLIRIRNIKFTRGNSLLLLFTYVQGITGKEWVSLVNFSLTLGRIVWEKPLAHWDYNPGYIKYLSGYYSRLQILNNGLVEVALYYETNNGKTGVMIVNYDPSDDDISVKLTPLTLHSDVDLLLDKNGDIYGLYTESYKYIRLVKLNDNLNVIWGIEFPQYKYWGPSSNGTLSGKGRPEKIILTPDGKTLIVNVNARGSSIFINRLIYVINSSSGEAEWAYITQLEGEYPWFNLLGYNSDAGFLLGIMNNFDNHYEFSIAKEPFVELNNTQLQIEDGYLGSNIPAMNDTLNVAAATPYRSRSVEWNQIRYNAIYNSYTLRLIEYPPSIPKMLRHFPDKGIYRYGTYYGLYEYPAKLLYDNSGNLIMINIVHKLDPYDTPFLHLLKIAANGSIITNKLYLAVSGPVQDAVVAPDGYIYIVTSKYYFPYYAYNTYLYRINTETLEPEWILSLDDGISSIIPDPSGGKLYLLGTERFICTSSYCTTHDANATIIVVDISGSSPTLLAKKAYRLLGPNGEWMPGAFMFIDGDYNPPYIYASVLYNLSSSGGGGIIAYIFKININNYQLEAVKQISFQATTTPEIATITLPITTKIASDLNLLIIAGTHVYYNITSKQNVDTDAAVMAVGIDLAGVSWCKIWGPHEATSNHNDATITSIYDRESSSIYLGVRDSYNLSILRIDPLTGSLVWAKILQERGGSLFPQSLIVNDNQGRVVLGFGSGPEAGDRGYVWESTSSGYGDCYLPGISDSGKNPLVMDRTPSGDVYTSISYAELLPFMMSMGHDDARIASLHAEEGSPYPIPESSLITTITIIITLLLMLRIFRRR